MYTYFDKSFFGQLLIDFRPVGDVLCPVGVLQCAQRLLQVGLSRRHGGNDGSLSFPTEGVLQHPSQLALAVGDMRGMFNESCDDPTKSQETLVDVAGLSGSLVHSTGTSNVLTASQINLEACEHTECIHTVHIYVHNYLDVMLSAQKRGFHIPPLIQVC